MGFKLTAKTKIDMSGFKKLKKQIEKQHLQIGYISTPTHWVHEGTKSQMSVAEVARQVHDMGWNEFMLSKTNTFQAKTIVNYNLNKMFGLIPFTQLLEHIGNDLAEQVKENIRDTTSPSISAEWAAFKGSVKPLQYGSLIGESPNLLDTVNYEIKIGSLG